MQIFYLKRLVIAHIAYFDRPDVGIVQTRWGHLNAEYSILTRVQAFALICISVWNK